MSPCGDEWRAAGTVGRRRARLKEAVPCSSASHRDPPVAPPWGPCSAAGGLGGRCWWKSGPKVDADTTAP
jgi:hypothetical protein